MVNCVTIYAHPIIVLVLSVAAAFVSPKHQLGIAVQAIGAPLPRIMLAEERHTSRQTVPYGVFTSFLHPHWDNRRSQLVTASGGG